LASILIIIHFLIILAFKKLQVKELKVHRFIRILKLCNLTFQCFAVKNSSLYSSFALGDISSWLLQETTNTISAASILLIDECSDILSNNPPEQKRMIQGILDLLMNILSTPQSSVTLLRTMGAASHALEKFGSVLFLEVIDDNLQHWARLILTFMNSTSMAVRSMAVDFVVSLLGSSFRGMS